MGLPLGPRVELSKIPGLSGSVSRAGAAACCASTAERPMPTAAVTVRKGLSMGELYDTAVHPSQEPGTRNQNRELGTLNGEPRTENREPSSEPEHELRSENREG